MPQVPGWRTCLSPRCPPWHPDLHVLYSTNAAGNYTISALSEGTYFLYTSNNQGLRNEYYDDIPCVVFCLSTIALTAGTPVPVSLGTTTAGRNFRLETGGSITGVVTNAATGQPLPIRQPHCRREGRAGLS